MSRSSGGLFRSPGEPYRSSGPVARVLREYGGENAPSVSKPFLKRQAVSAEGKESRWRVVMTGEEFVAAQRGSQSLVLDISQIGWIAEEFSLLEGLGIIKRSEVKITAKEIVNRIKTLLQDWFIHMWSQKISSTRDWFSALLKLMYRLDTAEQTQEIESEGELWMIFLHSINYLKWENIREELLSFELWKKMPDKLHFFTRTKKSYSVSECAAMYVALPRMVKIVREEREDFCDSDEGRRWLLACEGYCTI